MAFIYGDPNPSGPFPTFQDKNVRARAFKLTFAQFTTTGVNSLIGALPADASILSIGYWVKTAFSGGGVTAVGFSLGSASAGTQFVNAMALTNTTGTRGPVSPLSGILQPYQIPYGNDIQLWVNGNATTGNPTAGELYLVVEYVR